MRYKHNLTVVGYISLLVGFTFNPMTEFIYFMFFMLISLAMFGQATAIIYKEWKDKRK